MIDFDSKTDSELHKLRSSIDKILRVRRSAEEANLVIDEAIRNYAKSAGRSLAHGEPFSTPTGAHNAYPNGVIVTHDGKLWRATRSGANGTPGESPDWRQVAADGEILPWQTVWAGQEYEQGDQVHHEGRLWEAERLTGHEPGTEHSGWTDIGPWPPEDEPEEPTDPEPDPEEPVDPEEPEPEPEPEEPDEIPDWVQPTAGTEYPIDAVVFHNERIWRNTHPANAWEPGTQGSQWVDVTDEY